MDEFKDIIIIILSFFKVIKTTSDRYILKQIIKVNIKQN